jgi:ABC-type molybdate transport system substrate-binding protein
MGHGAGSIIGLRVAWIVMSGLTVLLGQPDLAAAAEIKIFSTRAIATVLEKVGPEFERTTGHRLNVTTDIAIRMVRRIQAGEPFDFLVAVVLHHIHRRRQHGLTGGERSKRIDRVPHRPGGASCDQGSRHGARALTA